MILSAPIPTLDKYTLARIPHYRKVLKDQGVPMVDEAGDEEILTLLQHMEDLAQGHSMTADRLIEEDYWRTPPSIQEFCEDDFWLGLVMKRDDSIQQLGLFPKWREEIYKAMSPGRNLSQIIMTGAIGLGKSMVGSVILLYRLARILCLRSPTGHYGLNRTSRLILSAFSVTKDQVMGGVFQDMINMMGNSPFFNEVMPVGDKKFSSQRIDFPRNVQLKAGSRIHQALGGNVLVSLIDEINFRLEADAAKAAKNLVQGLERRQESRFRQHLDRLLILISSARSQVDFLTTHIERNRNNPSVVVWDFSLWEIRGGVTIHYKGPKFPVDIGDNINPPRILDLPDLSSRPPCNELEVVAKQALDSIPSSRLLWVPEEHRLSFEEDPEAAIRDIGGRVTGRMSKFLPDSMPIIRCLTDHPDPFVPGPVRISVTSTHHVTDFLEDRGRRLVGSHSSGYLPLHYPGAPRYIHMDMATGGQDAFGMAMVHPIYQKSQQRMDLATQQVSDTMQTVYGLDFAIPVRREVPGQDIDFSKIRTFIAWLTKVGFNIRGISCDLRSLSTEMRAILTKMGYNATYLSVDKTRVPYDTLKQVIMEARFRFYNNHLLATELVNLVDNIDKIDHPDKFDVQWKKGYLQGERGSKDLSDAVAGAVYLAEMDVSRPPVPLIDIECIVGSAPKTIENLGNSFRESAASAIIPTF